MTKFRIILVGMLASLLMTVGLSTADAAVYKWANTRGVDGSTIVEYCDGYRTTLSEGERLSKDVCKVRVATETNLYVYVSETGKELFDYYNCNTTARWVSFNSKTDTSRTALVHSYKVACA